MKKDIKSNIAAFLKAFLVTGMVFFAVPAVADETYNYDYYSDSYYTYDYPSQDYGYSANSYYTYDYSNYNNYDYYSDSYYTYDYSNYNNYDYYSDSYYTYDYSDAYNYDYYSDSYYTYDYSDAYDYYSDSYYTYDYSNYGDYYADSYYTYDYGDAYGDYYADYGDYYNVGDDYYTDYNDYYGNYYDDYQDYYGGQDYGYGCSTGCGQSYQDYYDGYQDYYGGCSGSSCNNNNYDDNCYNCNDDDRDRDERLRVVCVPSDTRVNVGDRVTFSAEVEGGDSPFTYRWSGDISGNNRTESTRFDRAGRYEVTVTVTDSDGRRDSDDCNVVIVEEEDEEEDDFSVVCVASATRIDEGESVTFTADVTGGDSPFTYRWTGDISGSDRDDRTETVTFNEEGDYLVTVTVRDSDGNEDSDDCPVIIVDDEQPEEDFDVVCIASDTRIEEGDSVTFEAEVEGGESPFEYDWSGDISGSDRDDRTETVTFNDEGDYEVRVTVTDADGNTASDDCPVIIVDDEDTDDDDFDVVCIPSDTRIEEGDTVTFEAEVDGGESPFEYDWSGDISGDDRTERVRFNREGRYEVEVTVTDDDGNEASDDCPVVVVDDEDDDDDDDDTDVNLVSAPPFGTPAALSSVYLSQVPYTGPEDAAMFFGTLVLAVMVSGAIVYMRAQRKAKAGRKEVIESFKKANMAKKGII